MMRDRLRRLYRWLTFSDLPERAAGAFVRHDEFDASRRDDARVHAEIAAEVARLRRDLDAIASEARMHERLVSR